MLNNAKRGVGKRFQHLFRLCFNNIAREALYKAFFNSCWLTIFEMRILEIFGWFEMNMDKSRMPVSHLRLPL